MKNHEREVNFLRAFISHYSFVTGLAGLLAGGSGDSSVGVNVLLNADITEGYRVKDPMGFSTLEEAPYHNVLRGSVFQCCDLLSFIAGTYDSKKLKESHRFEPTQFVIETWSAIGDDLYKWRLTKNTIWEGVKWLDAAHTTDGGDRCCAGIATFVCDKKTVEVVENSDVVVIPEKANYPRFALRDVLKKALDGPKHPDSYLG